MARLCSSLLIIVLLTACSKEQAALNSTYPPSNADLRMQQQTDLMKSLSDQDQRNDYGSIKLILTNPTHKNDGQPVSLNDILPVVQKYKVGNLTADKEVRTFANWKKVKQELELIIDSKKTPALTSQFRQAEAFIMLFRTDLLSESGNTSEAVQYGKVILKESESPAMLYFTVRNLKDKWSELNLKQVLPESLKQCRASMNIIKGDLENLKTESKKLKESEMSAHKRMYERLVFEVEDHLTTDEYYLSKLENLAIN